MCGAVQVISLGHKDNVTVMQVKQNTEMESHEEKLHKMIIQSKINDTKVLCRSAAISFPADYQPCIAPARCNTNITACDYSFVWCSLACLGRCTASLNWPKPLAD